VKTSCSGSPAESCYHRRVETPRVERAMARVHERTTLLQRRTGVNPFCWTSAKSTSGLLKVAGPGEVDLLTDPVQWMYSTVLVPSATSRRKVRPAASHTTYYAS
jgi:hypothetical protein